MSKIYVIDACALIDAAKNYNMSKKVFEDIWILIDSMVAEGKLISSIEVKNELKDDDIKEWSKQNKEMFMDLTEEIQNITREILRKYPSIIKIQTKKNSNADPFLIATAIYKEGVMVTNEKKGKNKIPNICKELNVPCIDLKEFLDEILE